MHAGGGVGGQAMLKFKNNAGTLDHKDGAFEKPVLLSVIIKVPPPLCPLLRYGSAALARP